MNFLYFLMNPAFVITWYLFGFLSSIIVAYDIIKYNTNVNTALKVGWPIIIIFFSAFGLLLYIWSCRPPYIKYYKGETAKKYHHEYVKIKWKRVTGSVIHCVGGDGLGIMTAMVISRIIGLTFWQEFWFEYIVGFLFGWFVFQFIAMRKMSDSALEALIKAGRAEFFSMITVMIGMGLVMRFVTPVVVGSRPTPDTAAFWGFASLGLLVGAIVTYPMNWWLVSIGWKHGMS